MKIKAKLTTRNIFHYIFFLIIIANMFLLFFAYSFLKKNIYDTIFMSEEEVVRQNKDISNNIDLEKFKNVIEEIEKRREKKNLRDLKNIFY